ncbi:lactonase family protein [Fulvivirga sp. M361]|uniref:lactonase family protein n=1 Tax=Fulvivirga sp. M361 TaxID=2594266 RepID=UPI001179EB2B|nr:lactonase family protein [Fulvivirga sp. M361]TRX48795.1 lactonase family protein [Fulvivirga sp. M361]
MFKLSVSAISIVYCLIFSLALLSCQSKRHKILIGTYTTNESEGIYLCSFDEGKEVLTLDGLAAKTENPSYLAITKSGDHIFAVNETRDGNVTSFNRDGNRLVQSGISTINGEHPCYIDISPDQQFIAVANYTSGNFSTIRLTKDGNLDSSPVSWQHTGKGTDSTRQEAPHAHCAKWVDKSSFLIADLGIDRILPYRIDNDSKLEKVSEGTKMKDGCGPRHIVFHPHQDIVYAACELSNEVAVLEFDPVSFKLISKQYASTLPTDFDGSNTNADLHVSPDGKYLYVSNRGHNSIAAFKIMDNGQLNPTGHFPTRGEKPRNFTILPGGKHLLVANQDSNNIVAFRINSEDGSLEFTGSEIKVSSPVCLKSFNN